MRKTIAICIMTLFILSCAHVEIRKVESADAEGIRFYRPWPYLMVAVNDKGLCVPSIIYLPDMSQEYTMIPHSGLGSATLKPTLKDGWNLTAYDSSVDSKIPETIGAISGLVAKLPIPPLARALPPPKKTNLSPGLYRLEWQNDHFVLEEDKKVFQLQTIEGKPEPVYCPTLALPQETTEKGSKKEEGSTSKQ